MIEKGFPMLKGLLLLVMLWSLGCSGSGSPDPARAPATFQFSLATQSATIQAGGKQDLQLSISRTGGFDQPVQFTVLGFPVGALGTFSPNPAPGSSTTLHLVAAADTPTGTYSVVVQASAGGNSPSLPLTFTVSPAPDFQLGVTTTNLTLTQGTSVSTQVNLNRSGGLADGVNFSVDGLPSGLTAVFTPNPATGSTSSLTFSASASCTPGTYALNLQGAAGSLQHATLLNVTVSPAPDFQLSTTYPSLAMAQGTSASIAVNLNRSGGFEDGVSFSADGLPVGLTAVFASNPATGSYSFLNFTASASCAPGTYSLTLRGVSGSLQRTTPLSVAVGVPGPDFSLGGAGNAWVVSPGGGMGQRFYVTRAGGFTGAVELSVEGLPTDATASISPNPAVGDSSVVTVRIPTTVAEGKYAISLKGSSGTLWHTSLFVLWITKLPALVLSLDPSSVVLDPGTQANVSASIQRREDITGPVTLFGDATLPSGLSLAGFPMYISGNSTSFPISADAAMEAGNYALAFFAMGPGGGGGGRSLPVTVRGFKVSLDSNVQLFRAGSPSDSSTTVRISHYGGDASSLALSLEGLPAGITAAFTPTPTSGDSSLLTLHADGNAPEGSVALTLRCIGNGRTRVLPLALVVSGTATSAFHPVGPPLWEYGYGSRAVKLKDGRVLLTGGDDMGPILASTEFFDPSLGGGIGGFVQGPPMKKPRYLHTATLLRDGRVLMVGGDPSSGSSGSNPATAEIFDPSANGGKGAFALVSATPAGGTERNATLLPDGRVMIFGGNSVEVFDPLGDGGKGTFSPFGQLLHERAHYAFQSLLDGSVVIYGGDGYSPLDAVERFTPGPVTGLSAPLAWLKVGRFFHCAAGLVDGSALVVGGADPSYSGPKAFVEHYDPAGAGGRGISEMLKPMNYPRALFSLTQLRDGRLLAVGGQTNHDNTATAETFDPLALANAWLTTGNLSAPRAGHLAILLDDGRVLILGGGLRSAEVYQP